jgi:hypothetical protein
MRLILIDNHSRLIFGDTANYRLGGLDEWRKSNSDDNSDIERLSLLAARLLDDSSGEHGREYEFINYDPRDTRTGYFIYRADINDTDALPAVTESRSSARCPRSQIRSAMACSSMVPQRC